MTNLFERVGCAKLFTDFLCGRVFDFAVAGHSGGLVGCGIVIDGVFAAFA
jgi:hypothetical protein